MERTILQTLKIHTKFSKIATMIIFDSGDQEKKEIHIQLQ